MILKLEKLEIKNFAGIRNKTFDFNGQDVEIRGANRSGKTTTETSVNWLLFGKNADGRTVENIIPLDTNQEERWELVPTVEAVFNINGTKQTFRKESHPVTRKDQYGREEYKNSRKTSQYIDEVPYKITDFNKEIEKLIDENIFKLLTNINEFPRWNYKDKRELLFDMSGEVKDIDVINSNDRLKPLLDTLDGKDIEEEKLKFNSQLKRYKEDLKNIPVKIDTLHNQLPNVTDEDYSKEIEALEKELNVLSDKRHSLLNGGKVVEYKNVLQEKRNALKELERQHDAELAFKGRKYQNELDLLESNLLNLENNLQQEERYHSSLDADLKAKRAEWKEYYNKREKRETEQFKWESDTVCNCCGQELPQDQVEKLKADAQAKFNLDKSNGLAEIEQDMARAQHQGKELAEYVDESQKRIQKHKNNIEEVKKDISLVNNQLQRQKEEATDVKTTDAYKQLEEEINALVHDIERHNGEATEEVEAVDAEMNNLKERLTELRNKEAEIAMSKRIETEIENLSQKETEYRSQIENLMYQLNLLDEFVVTKVNLITKNVNKMFEFVQFRMFNQQVNGELKETCEITVNGVSYDKGLNTEAKINASLDIIETISEYYNTYAPIFIDNAESVTRISKTTSQQVKLIVDDNYKELTLTELV